MCDIDDIPTNEEVINFSAENLLINYKVWKKQLRNKRTTISELNKYRTRCEIAITNYRSRNNDRSDDEYCSSDDEIDANKYDGDDEEAIIYTMENIGYMTKIQLEKLHIRIVSEISSTSEFVIAIKKFRDMCLIEFENCGEDD
jgi:hypothetical protein